MSESLTPDLGRLSSDLETLATFRDPKAPGWTRPVFSAIDREGRAFVAERMREAGMEVETDAAANIIGRVRGTGRLAPAIVTGSHTDTVMGGGRFDGIIGVLGAVEAVRRLAEARVELAHDLVVVDFLGEEPNLYGLSCVGSRAVAGTLEPEHLALVGPEGHTLGEDLEAAGGDPAAVSEARWAAGKMHCFLELHIEQGPLLEQAGIPIGVVTGIVGIHRFLAGFEGQADHAGTTPMALRRDALLAAAEAALAIERLAAAGEAGGGVAVAGSPDAGGVATAGRLEVRPGANNVVPAESELWAESRSPDDGWLAEFDRRIEAEVAAIGERRRMGSSLRRVSHEEPVLATDWVMDVFGRAAAVCSLDTLALPSGAGHDAAQMARLSPMGMIFVPSRDGRSHCPEEWTDLEQIGDGVAVLAEAIRLADSTSE